MLHFTHFVNTSADYPFLHTVALYITGYTVAAIFYLRLAPLRDLVCVSRAISRTPHFFFFAVRSSGCVALPPRCAFRASNISLVTAFISYIPRLPNIPAPFRRSPFLERVACVLFSFLLDTLVTSPRLFVTLSLRSLFIPCINILPDAFAVHITVSIRCIPPFLHH